MHVATLALDDLLIVQARDGLEWIQRLVAHFIACNLTRPHRGKVERRTMRIGPVNV